MESIDDLGMLAVVVNPPRACPGCLARVGQPWPDNTTSAYCGKCVAQMRRIYQCRKWNANPAHQRAAGHASFSAFSARWRASSGMAPLTSDAARRYVTPEMIRGPVGMLIPERVRNAVYRAWCEGQTLSVEAWLSDDPPPDPDGLWSALVSQT